MDLVTSGLLQGQSKETTDREKAVQPNGKSSVANLVDRIEARSGSSFDEGQRTPELHAQVYASARSGPNAAGTVTGMRFAAAVLSVAVLGSACSSAGSGGGSSTGPGDELWRTTAMQDAVTGEEVRIADLEGKVVAIEAMAIWCTTCRTQQLEAQAALEQVGSPDVVYISLDVDPNERPADLAEYARREGFEWRFVVAPQEVSRSLARTFGDQILSPPATPLVVLAPDGRVVEQHIGIKSAGDLAALFEEHLP